MFCLFQNAANGLLLPEKEECAVGPWKSVLQAYCLLLLLPNDCAPGMYLHLFAKAKRAPRREHPWPLPALCGERSCGNWGSEGDSLCRGWRTLYIAFVSRDLSPRSRCGEQPSHPCCSVFLGSGRATLVLLFPIPRLRNSPLALHSLCGVCALLPTPFPDPAEAIAELIYDPSTLGVGHH